LSTPKLLGRWGQKQCEKFLRKKGFKSLTRNFSCKTGEIDIIMLDIDGTIVFVEVKTRADESFTNIESAITSAKKSRLIKTARFFLTTYKIENRPFRFDVLAAVVGRKGPVNIKHYQNAFVP
jgi:putative endonuclease